MIDRLLDPRSIAVVGASRDPAKRGYQAVQRLVEDGYGGPIYPVSPSADEILGLHVYQSIDDVPGPVDLALIVRPAEHVPEAIEACGRNGVAGAVILAVGFGETGQDGRRLERRVVEAAEANGIRLIGPNTSGVFNRPASINLVGVPDIPSGRIGVISQSGNVILELIADAQTCTAGFSTYVGVGNEADIRYHELLASLRGDPNTDVVIVYAEGFKDGRAFLQEVRRTVKTKPVVIHKAGRTEIGTRSASSHTGAMAGDFRLAEAAIRQAGGVSVMRSDELIPVAQSLSTLPPIGGRRIVVLADGGGHATMAADTLTQRGLSLPTLGEETQRRLASLLPEAASLTNPVDVAGGADRDPGVFSELVSALIDDPEVDGILIVGLFGGYSIRFSPDYAIAEDEAARAIGVMVADRAKPVIVQTIYAGTTTPALETLKKSGVPVHRSIDIASRCIEALVERYDHLRHFDQRSDLLVGSGLSTGEVEVLAEPDARHLLEEAGVSLPTWTFARDRSEVSAAASGMTGQLALKIVADGVSHKTDVGGVELNVSPVDAADLFEAMSATVTNAVPGTVVRGVVVAPMEPAGIELIVGATRDVTFGPMIAVGLGGVLVEELDRVVFRAAPLTALEAHLALDELGGRLVDGFRGGRSHRDQMVDLLLSVSNLLTSDPKIQQVDLNPTILGPNGVVPVDARVVVSVDRAD